MARMPTMPMPNSCAGRKQRVEQVVRILDREVQLPAERADEIDAQRVHVGGEADFDRATGEPRETTRCRAARR